MVAVVLAAASASAQESTSRKLVERIDPGYPVLAKKNGITGSVKLRVDVGADGRPRTVEIIGGNPVLAETAKDSVKKWKWAASERESTEVVEVKFESGT